MSTVPEQSPGEAETEAPHDPGARQSPAPEQMADAVQQLDELILSAQKELGRIQALLNGEESEAAAAELPPADPEVGGL